MTVLLIENFLFDIAIIARDVDYFQKLKYFKLVTQISRYYNLYKEI